ncbi:hypothetical protein BN12_40057 [Nostocoides japonicum T1-X7]|uniref:Uncharacterized protein n=1 Tax=Nostocoides japonicum T1-X7 TaxID=1194083 RepID=A0A077M1Z9_9MICO|nr:hypothetical protein [Tetrasphaera japonica]CCH79087.1 hypothetical protein BN12_40057 [Tetrasphaera japonica T1-X7]
MADRGRDLKINVLSDASQFDLDGPAKDLETLGKEAQETADKLDGLNADRAERDLKSLGDAADSAQRDLHDLTQDTGKTGDRLDDLGRDAKETAQKVDSAFDSIARSSKSKFRAPVDEDVSHFKDKMGEVHEESSDTAREMFASFSDVSSLQDAAQEIAANVGGLFGPIGLAIGGALSVGIATFTQKWSEAKEKVKEQTASIVALMQEAGGQIRGSDLADAVSQAITADPKAFADTKKRLTDLGLSWQDYYRAQAGDTDAAGRFTAALRSQIDALNGQLGPLDQVSAAHGRWAELSQVGGQNTQALAERLRALQGVQGDVQSTTQALTDAQSLYNDITSATDKTAAALNDEYAALADSTDVYSAAVERASDKNRDHKVTVDDIIAEQRKAMKAQTEFADNMDTVRQRFGEAGAQMVADAGEDGPAIAQALADGPKKKSAEAVANYRKMGASARSGMQSGVRPDDPFTIGVKAQADYSSAYAARSAFQQWLWNNPLHVSIQAQLSADSRHALDSAASYGRSRK